MNFNLQTLIVQVGIVNQYLRKRKYPNNPNNLLNNILQAITKPKIYIFIVSDLFIEICKQIKFIFQIYVEMIHISLIF